MRRVVVTGLGAVTALGHNLDQTYQGLISGHSGVGKICSFDASSHATQIAAEVRNLPFEKYFTSKELRKHDRFSQFAWIAAQEAMEHSGLKDFEFDGERAGIFIGSGVGGILTQESTAINYQKRGSRGVSPFFI